MRPQTTKMKNFLRNLVETAVQGAALIGLWWLCDAAVRAAGLPIPGGVAGMVVLLALLASGLLPVGCLRLGAKGLLNHMLLFFVPAAVVLRDHTELLGSTGLKVLAVIVVGILSVMAGTALAVELHIRLRSRHVR